MDIKESKILIVEDELEIRESYVRILTNSSVPSSQIRRSSNARNAIKLIRDFEPDMVLLDITIPLEEDGQPEPENVMEVLRTIRLHNLETDTKIRTIIISGTVKQKVIQEIIGTLNRQVIFDFIDKINPGIDYNNFKELLVSKINKALQSEFRPESIDYRWIISSNIKKLRKINEDLYNKIYQEILDEFQKLNEKNINEHTTCRGIIISCGIVVEILIDLIEKGPKEIRSIQLSDDYEKIRNRLTLLSGRIYDDSSKKYNLNESTKSISRKACHYAIQLYWLRNQVSHASEVDRKNTNIYKGTQFLKEDAVIAITLLMPLINDYIEIVKSN